ncbi:hypothetical protein LCGC14_3031850, partial [marine sediment metagenome]
MRKLIVVLVMIIMVLGFTIAAIIPKDDWDLKNFYNIYNVKNMTVGTINVTGNSILNLNWTYLQNYPIACPAGTFLTQLDDSVTCTAPVADDIDPGDFPAGNYTFDTNLLFIDSSNDRVGIGTTIPNIELEVNGKMGFTATEYVSTDAVGYTDIHSATDKGVRLHTGSSEIKFDDIGISSNYMRLVTPANYFYYHIGGAYRMYWYQSRWIVGGNMKWNDNTGVEFGSGGGLGLIGDTKIFYNGADLIIDPDVVGTGKVLIGATGDDDLIAGNVGIGTTTPQNLLNVIGDGNFTGNLILGEKITFTLGEIIDNIVDGWITITGNLNVTGNVTAENVFLPTFLFAHTNDTIPVA